MSNFYDDDRDDDDDDDDEDDDDDDTYDDDDDDVVDDEEVSPTPIRRTYRRTPKAPTVMQNTPPRQKSSTEHLQLIADAIQVHEGWILPGRGYPRGSRSYRNNNPGNLRYAQQVNAIGQDSAGFAIFPSASIGRDALLRDLGAKFKRNPALSIAQLVHIYAPASDNNDELAYVRAIEAHINANV